MKLRSQDVTWQEIDGELVILDLASSTYLTTNATGAFLAKQLNEERTEDELVTAMVAQYGVEAETARTDVQDFLADLRRLELLA